MSRIRLALMLLALLAVFGGLNAQSLPKEESGTFNPDILQSLPALYIGGCKMTNGVQVYCEVYQAPKNRLYVALYISIKGVEVLMVVKLIDKDGKTQKNVWQHEVLSI